MTAAWDEFFTALSNEIERARLDRSLTAKGLAAEIGVQASVLSRIKHGSGKPSRDTVRLICDGIGIDFEPMDRLLARARISGLNQYYDPQVWNPPPEVVDELWDSTLHISKGRQLLDQVRVVIPMRGGIREHEFKTVFKPINGEVPRLTMEECEGARITAEQDGEIATIRIRYPQALTIGEPHRYRYRMSAEGLMPPVYIVSPFKAPIREARVRVQFDPDEPKPKVQLVNGAFGWFDSIWDPSRKRVPVDSLWMAETPTFLDLEKGLAYGLCWKY